MSSPSQVDLCLILNAVAVVNTLCQRQSRAADKRIKIQFIFSLKWFIDMNGS